MANVHRATWHQEDEHILKGAFIPSFLDMMESEATLPRRYRMALDDLKKRNDIVVLPADKGSKMVILDRSVYINSAEEMLSDTNIYKKLNGRQQLTYRITRLNLMLNRIQSALPTTQRGERSSLLEPFIIHDRSSQSMPYAYFLFKAHKAYPPSNFAPLSLNALPSLHLLLNMSLTF